MKNLDLNLPKANLRIKDENGKQQIFDNLRRKYVALTPEEWVRQNFVFFLVNIKKFPSGLMNNEIALVQNGIKRRCDTLVSDKYGNPFVIVEYKAPHIDISQTVFDQIVRYNMVLKAKYLIVSNGISHYCCMIDYDKNNYIFLPDIPNYDDL